MTPEEAVAREAIRDTVASYNRATDQGSYDDLREVFTPDATLVIQGATRLHGVESIIQALQAGATRRASRAPGNFQRHMMGAAMIQMGGEAGGSARHYFVVISELGLDHTGVYEDEYLRVGNRWLIAGRSVQMEWARDESRFVRWLGAAGPMSLG